MSYAVVIQVVTRKLWNIDKTIAHLFSGYQFLRIENIGYFTEWIILQNVTSIYFCKYTGANCMAPVYLTVEKATVKRFSHINLVGLYIFFIFGQ